MPKTLHDFALLAAFNLFLALSFSGAAWAHHGRDFLLSRTAELPHPKQLYVIARQDYIAEDDGSEFELEPGFLIGVTPWIALELHAHFAREQGGSFEYESTAPGVQLRFAPTRGPWAVGLFAEYEFSHVADAEDKMEAIAILSASGDKSRLAFNLSAERDRPSDEGIEWHYALGFKTRWNDKLDWGIEGQGSFERDSAHEGLLGLYFDATDRLTLNVGLGTAIGHEGPDISVRTAVVWRLR